MKIDRIVRKLAISQYEAKGSENYPPEPFWGESSPVKFEACPYLLKDVELLQRNLIFRRILQRDLFGLNDSPTPPVWRLSIYPRPSSSLLKISVKFFSLTDLTFTVHISKTRVFLGRRKEFVWESEKRGGGKMVTEIKLRSWEKFRSGQRRVKRRSMFVKHAAAILAVSFCLLKPL